MALGLDNPAVTSSLQTLSAAHTAMSASAQRISTGRRIISARDDGAAYAIARNIQSDLVGESVRHQNQLRAQSLLDVTQSAVTSIADILSQMKDKALALNDTSLDTTSRTALTSDLTMLTHQVDQVVGNSSFNGKNLLEAVDLQPNDFGSATSGYVAHASSSQSISGNSGRLDVAVDYAKATASNVTINWGDGATTTANNTYSLPYTGSTVFSHVYDDSNSSRSFSLDITATTQALATAPKGVQVPWMTYTPDPQKSRFAIYADGSTLNVTHKPMSAQALGIDDLGSLTDAQALAAVDNAIAVTGAYATYFAGKQQAVDRALKLTEQMTGAFEAGYGNLVDADLGKESANWQARQTQVQLATQALSIANQSPKILLSLFRQ